MEARGVISRVEAQINAGQTISLSDAIALSSAYIDSGRLADARALLVQLKQVGPAPADVAYALGALYELVGERALARIRFEEAVEGDPDHLDARLRLAKNYHAGSTPGQIQRARDQLETVLARDSSRMEAWRLLAAMSYGAGQFEAAERAYREIIAREPSNVDAWHELSTLLQHMDRREDAVAALERAVALKPENLQWASDLRDAQNVAARKRKPLARFPKNVVEFKDIRNVIDRYVLPDLDGIAPFLSPGSPVLTTGSCFAVNIALALASLGVEARHVTQAEDLNNTYANRYLFEWLCGEENSYSETFDKNLGAAVRATLFETMGRAKAIIYSLGVAPVFFDRDSKRPVLSMGDRNIALQGDKVEFRTTTVAENVENLRVIERLIRSYNPDAPFVLTVSPVPLAATQEFRSAIVADCVSKSTLRVAAHEFLASSVGNSLYWPSFEMVRWIGGYTGDMFGAEDGSPRHVSESVVDAIMRAFINRFGDDALQEKAKGRSGYLAAPTENAAAPTFLGDFA